jgi:ethanolamine permease
MVSLLVLRKREPQLARPFRAPLYPIFPLTALGLASVCFIAVLRSQPRLGMLTAVLFGLCTLYYQKVARHRVLSTETIP